MIDQVLENVRRFNEFNVRTQQRLFNKWTGLWGLSPVPSEAPEKMVTVQKRWIEFVTELVKKQRETLEPQVKAGLAIFEEACHLVEAKDPEDLRAKTVELWHKSFDCVRQVCETQIHTFETAVTRWFDLVTKAGTVPEEEKAAA
jgi:hypothetical protein